MIEVLIVYCVFMYLFTGGIGSRSALTGDNNEGRNLGRAIHFITAPVSTPIVLGIIFASNNP